MHIVHESHVVPSTRCVNLQGLQKRAGETKKLRVVTQCCCMFLIGGLVPESGWCGFVQVDQVLVGKAVDCLRILTTGNEANKAALFAIPSALSSLGRLMGNQQPSVRPNMIIQ